LKHYINLLAHAPGLGAEGYDQQNASIRQIFGFFGFTDIRKIFLGPTLFTTKDETQATAKFAATKAIEAF
jgi:FMN-dependent NADH-azoreductase